MTLKEKFLCFEQITSAALNFPTVSTEFSKKLSIFQSKWICQTSHHAQLKQNEFFETSTSAFTNAICESTSNPQINFSGLKALVNCRINYGF